MKRLAQIVALGACLLLSTKPIFGASEAIFGLESVKLDRIYDPNARPERLMLVSGSLKLDGGVAGNRWQSVTYIPQRTAAPRTDYGIFVNRRGRIQLYSFVTFSRYYGQINPEGDQIVIQKRSASGESQTETWYIVR